MQYNKLTGGTVFTLIVEGVVKPSAEKVLAQGYNEHKNPTILYGLLKIAYYNYQNPTFFSASDTQVISRYKNCKINDSESFVPVRSNSVVVSSFKSSMNVALDNCLNRTKEFIDTFLLDKTKNVFLGNALYRLIIDDITIADDALVYIDNNGQLVTKSYLKNLETISLPSIILGAWYYALTNDVSNVLGRSTIESWQRGKKIYPNIWNLTEKNVLGSDGRKLIILENEDELINEYKRSNSTNDSVDNLSLDDDLNFKFDDEGINLDDYPAEPAELIDDEDENESKENKKNSTYNFICNGGTQNIYENNGTINFNININNRSK